MPPLPQADRPVLGGSAHPVKIKKRFRSFLNVSVLTLLVDFDDILSRSIDSNNAENFKRPKNREDSSNLHENLRESIASPQSFISEIFARPVEEIFAKNFTNERIFCRQWYRHGVRSAFASLSRRCDPGENSVAPLLPVMSTSRIHKCN